MRDYYENNEYDFTSILRVIVASLIILASIFTISIVIINVANIKILDGITVKGDDVKLTIDTEASTKEMFFVSDDKGLRCKKADGSFARDEWIEKNGELFYFDTSSYGKNGDLRFEGQIYTLENGKLKKMVRDKNYVISYDPNYYSSVDCTTYLAYLDKEENKDGYHAIMYKTYGDNEEGILGTIGDPQYSSPYMIKICENVIYYLSVGKKAPYAGVLYRMRPNASTREYVGNNVEGYIILNSDTVYYYDGARVINAKTWKEEEVNVYENIEELEHEIENMEDMPLPLPLGEEPIIVEDINAPISKKETSETKNNMEPIAIEDLPLPLPIGSHFGE